MPFPPESWQGLRRLRTRRNPGRGGRSTGPIPSQAFRPLRSCHGPPPMMETAANIASKADIFIVVGTSLMVYPAAGLVHYTDFTVPKYVIDPNKPAVATTQNVNYITEKASIGVKLLVDELMAD